MAKFEDYKHLAPNAGDLENEIDESARRTEERRAEDNVPERFKGKSPAEIAASYEELERRFGAQGNEIGSLRKKFDEFVEKAKSEKPAAPAPKPVTMDELYETPDATVRRVVKEESESRIERLERELEETRNAQNVYTARVAFEGKHTDYKDVMSDAGFIEWIKASKMRVTLAQAADAGNFDAADELFSTYKELKTLRTAKPAPKVEAARSVALERSGGNAPAPEETYSRSGLQEKRMAAQRGDRAAKRWLDAHSEAINSAYAEGRLSA